MAGNFDGKWGYDLDRVPAVHCVYCQRPIGAEPYVEITALARFGQMLFAHLRCDSARREAENEQRKKETSG